MSLTAEQKEQTSRELKENYRISGLKPDEIEVVLGFDTEQLQELLNLYPTPNPTNVWRLRDYMEEVIKEKGKQPYPYTSLRENIWYRYD